jgi:hypothetical protein
LTATVREVRQRFLAELAEVLITTTPDHESVLAQLATLAVRELADWVVIDLLEADQRRRFKVACSDPANRALAEELESFPIDRGRPT